MLYEIAWFFVNSLERNANRDYLILATFSFKRRVGDEWAFNLKQKN
jgi:hypothetical protein